VLWGGGGGSFLLKGDLWSQAKHTKVRMPWGGVLRGDMFMHLPVPKERGLWAGEKKKAEASRTYCCYKEAATNVDGGCDAGGIIG